VRAEHLGYSTPWYHHRRVSRRGGLGTLSAPMIGEGGV
jgi:hypothetical protein